MSIHRSYNTAQYTTPFTVASCCFVLVLSGCCCCLLQHWDCRVSTALQALVIRNSFRRVLCSVVTSVVRVAWTQADHLYTVIPSHSSSAHCSVRLRQQAPNSGHTETHRKFSYFSSQCILSSCSTLQIIGAGTSVCVCTCITSAFMHCTAQHNALTIISLQCVASYHPAVPVVAQYVQDVWLGDASAMHCLTHTHAISYRSTLQYATVRAVKQQTTLVQQLYTL
jgi:hypothetical protein